MEVYVKPRSKDFKIVSDCGEIVVFCKEEPVRGKVNKELVRELSRLFHRNVKLVSGFSSKQKRLFIKDVEKDEVERILSGK